MLDPLDDDLAPLRTTGGAASHSVPTGTVDLSDDAALLRGLLDEGPLDSGSSLSSSLGLLDESKNTIRALPLNETHLDDILRFSQQSKASDIHLSVGLPRCIASTAS